MKRKEIFLCIFLVERELSLTVNIHDTGNHFSCFWCRSRCSVQLQIPAQCNYKDMTKNSDDERTKMHVHGQYKFAVEGALRIMEVRKKSTKPTSDATSKR